MNGELNAADPLGTPRHRRALLIINENSRQGQEAVRPP